MFRLRGVRQELIVSVSTYHGNYMMKGGVDCITMIPLCYYLGIEGNRGEKLAALPEKSHNTRSEIITCFFEQPTISEFYRT